MDSVNFPGNVPTVAILTYTVRNTQVTVGYYHNTYRIDFHE